MTIATQVFEYVAQHATQIALFSCAMSFAATLFAAVNTYKTASSIKSLKSNINDVEKTLNIDIEKLKYSESKKIISFIEKIDTDSKYMFRIKNNDEMTVFFKAFENLNEQKKKKFVQIIRNENLREKRKILESLFSDDMQSSIFIRH